MSQPSSKPAHKQVSAEMTHRLAAAAGCADLPQVPVLGVGQQPLQRGALRDVPVLQRPRHRLALEGGVPVVLHRVVGAALQQAGDGDHRLLPLGEGRLVHIGVELVVPPEAAALA